MATANPNVDYAKELSDLRKTYAEAPPYSRLHTIRQRYEDSQNERGAVRLVTLVSCVEGLARSLVVAAAKPTTTAEFLRAYAPIERADATWLVGEVLRLNRLPEPQEHFPEDTWPLFTWAVGFRNLIVHEASYLGQDKSPSLHQATEEVLRELIRLGGLPAL